MMRMGPPQHGHGGVAAVATAASSSVSVPDSVLGAFGAPSWSASRSRRISGARTWP